MRPASLSFLPAAVRPPLSWPARAVLLRRPPPRAPPASTGAADPDPDRPGAASGAGTAGVSVVRRAIAAARPYRVPGPLPPTLPYPCLARGRQVEVRSLLVMGRCSTLTEGRCRSSAGGAVGRVAWPDAPAGGPGPGSTGARTDPVNPGKAARGPDGRPMRSRPGPPVSIEGCIPARQGDPCTGPRGRQAASVEGRSSGRAST